MLERRKWFSLHFSLSILQNGKTIKTWTIIKLNSTSFSLLLLLLLLFWSPLCNWPVESEDTLSVQRPQPHTTNQWKEKKDKTVGDKKERADHANRKELALLLKPASPTPSNTGSLRSFQRDSERGTKLLRY